MNGLCELLVSELSFKNIAWSGETKDRKRSEFYPDFLNEFERVEFLQFSHFL